MRNEMTEKEIAHFFEKEWMKEKKRNGIYHSQKNLAYVALKYHSKNGGMTAEQCKSLLDEIDELTR